MEQFDLNYPDFINQAIKDKTDILHKVIITKAEKELGHSLDTKEVDAAIGKAQRRIVIAKTKQAHQYKYADLPEVLAQCYPIFEEFDLTLKQPPYEENGHIGIQTIIAHNPSGQWISSKMPLPSLKGTEKNDCQAIGSMQTYFRRYSLLSLIGLDDEDDDGYKAAAVKMETKQQPQSYDASAYLSDKQLDLLRSKINQFPEQAKMIKDVDITKILKKEFSGILSIFPNYQNN